MLGASLHKKASDSYRQGSLKKTTNNSLNLTDKFPGLMMVFLHAVLGHLLISYLGRERSFSPLIDRSSDLKESEVD